MFPQPTPGAPRGGLVVAPFRALRALAVLHIDPGQAVHEQLTIQNPAARPGHNAQRPPIAITPQGLHLHIPPEDGRPREIPGPVAVSLFLLRAVYAVQADFDLLLVSCQHCDGVAVRNAHHSAGKCPGRGGQQEEEKQREDNAGHFVSSRARRMFTSSRSTALPGRRSSRVQQVLPALRGFKSLRKLALQLGYAGVATLNVHAQALHLHAEVAVLAKQVGVLAQYLD